MIDLHTYLLFIGASVLLVLAPGLALLPQFIAARHATLSVTTQLPLLGVTSNVLALGINCALVCVASAVSGGLRRRSAPRAREALGERWT